MTDLNSTYPQEFYGRSTVAVARDLIGARLVRQTEGGALLHGAIVEVEAYTADDPACHAFKGLTPRCAVMFGPPGHAYVYFIYGMYFCLNVVTEAEGTAGAVLIRAVASEGTNGPGKLCRQWQIDSSHNGVSLFTAGTALWIARGQLIASEEIGISARIGISNAQERPWRFFLKDDPCVTPHPRPGEPARSKKRVKK